MPLPRRADAAGFRTALYAGLDVVGPLYATKTEFGRRFRRIVASERVPAAVRWLAAEFREQEALLGRGEHWALAAQFGDAFAGVEFGPVR